MCISLPIPRNPARDSSRNRGMDIIRSALAQEIFRQDLVSVYERQTSHRDELRRVGREKVAGLVQQISGGACENPLLESLLRELAGKLSKVKGKKVYGYLRPELKALVNQIVDEFARDEHIAQLYDLWYQDKQAARNVYDERPIERVPLSENPDFKPVRNAVVQAAVELEHEQSEVQRPAYTPTPPAHGHPPIPPSGPDFPSTIQLRPARGPAGRQQTPPQDCGEETGSRAEI